MAVLVNPPCVIFEDDHLLVVNKPPGWNTHSPAPYAGEGIYEWLKNRESRWAKLAIIHRLDKETSGVLIFSKTPKGNRSLTRQFTEGKVRKEYVLKCTRAPAKQKFEAQSKLTRAGDRYVSSVTGVDAETEFEMIDDATVLARPRTGRTHQIRVHAAENGFPIRGDVLYGGEPFARVCLHARRIEFTHPATKSLVTFETPANFDAPPGALLREAIIISDETNAYRLDSNVDRFGDYVLIQTAEPPAAPPEWKARGVYHKTTTPHVRGKSTEETSPKLIAGAPAAGPFNILENTARYEINFTEGYSVGLFLDQRDNRRRLLTNYIAPDFVVKEGGLDGAEILNTFAYTCAFSVCAALAGGRATSLDLSKKYLDWGRRNFELNGLQSAAHDFIYGDVFDWLKRLGKKGRMFDVVILDPPTFSKSKESGLFRAEQDYPRLITDGLKVLKPGGVLFASSNAARWAPEDFVRAIHASIEKTGRKILRDHYAPQPPDFPISKTQPAYLKTVWMRIE